MAYDTGVRQYLNGKGIADDQIGYDQASGYVTVGGQNFIKPTKNIEGTTFESSTNLNNAWNSYNQSRMTDSLLNRVNNPQQTANPYDQQITDLISQITTKMNTPATTNPYTTPEYAMYASQANQRANEGIRASQEALGTAGFGRSTALGQSAQREQNAATQYLETQVIPMILQNQQAKQQQELTNLMSLLTPLSNQQGVMDTRNRNQMQDMASVLEYLTGRSDRAEDVARQSKVDNMNMALQVGDQLGRVLAPKEDWGLLYNQTDAPLNFTAQQAELAQKNLEDEKAYRLQRDSEEDKRWWAEYQRAGEEFAASQGLQWAQLEQREKERIADEAYRGETLKLQKAESKLNQGLQLYKETGVMPDYMADLGFNINGLNNAKTKTEVEGLYQELASGALKPEDALKRIQDAKKLGLKDDEVLTELQKTVYMVDPSLDPSAPAKPGFWERMKSKYNSFVDYMNNFSGPQSRE